MGGLAGVGCGSLAFAGRRLDPVSRADSFRERRLPLVASARDRGARGLAGRATGRAGYGYRAWHSRLYWGGKLLLICTCDGTMTRFAVANPKLRLRSLGP